MARIAFQGVAGAYSEQAIHAYDPKAEAVPLPSFESVFDAVIRGRADLATVPIENSLHGSVHPNYDLLGEYELTILGELKLRITHHLLALPGVALNDLQRVRSHPQALGQCRKYLKQHLPHVETVADYDTAGAARYIAEHELNTEAAIASAAAASVYGLESLDAGIETHADNFTRFLILGPGGMQPPRTTGAMKTSLVFSGKENVPGLLFKALAVFALRDIDLLKIESRPQPQSPFEYVFYLDIAGGVGEPNVDRALGHLAEIAGVFRVLGSYPVGDFV
ncbi:MAG: prephenate dehydratase [Bacteroidota bacterium]